MTNSQFKPGSDVLQVATMGKQIAKTKAVGNAIPDFTGMIKRDLNMKAHRDDGRKLFQHSRLRNTERETSLRILATGAGPDALTVITAAVIA
jgi:hypothetical protein